MAIRTLLTIEQYNALEDPPGVRYELDRGELFVTPSPVPRHNIISGDIYRRLYEWVEEHNLGQVIYAVGVKLAEDTVRRPDAMFFRGERVRDVEPDQVPIAIVPDLVVEIVSKFDRPDDLMLRVRQYLRAGVQAVWVLYPKSREAYRYTPRSLQPTVLDADRGDRLEEPELLPGFSLSLPEILRRPKVAEVPVKATVSNRRLLPASPERIQVSAPPPRSSGRSYQPCGRKSAIALRSIVPGWSTNTPDSLLALQAIAPATLKTMA